MGEVRVLLTADELFGTASEREAGLGMSYSLSVSCIKTAWDQVSV